MPPIKGQKNPNMARKGSDNPRWKGGISSDYRRRIKNAKAGELVHHVNKNKRDNKASNLQVLKPNKKISARGIHNQKHPERRGK